MSLINKATNKEKTMTTPTSLIKGRIAFARVRGKILTTDNIQKKLLKAMTKMTSTKTNSRTDMLKAMAVYRQGKSIVTNVFEETNKSQLNKKNLTGAMRKFSIATKQPTTYVAISATSSVEA